MLQATSLYTYSTATTRHPGGLLAEGSGPDGVRTRYTYDAADKGLVVKTEVAYDTSLKQTSVYTYDAMGRATQTATGVGTTLARVDATDYNADTTIKRTVQNYKNGVFDAAKPDEDIITSYGYDKLGRSVAVTDTLGMVTATHYNPGGQVDWTIANLSPLQLDAQGQPQFKAFAVSAPAANVATTYGYDGLGRTVLVTETGLLTGTFTLASRTFSAVGSQVTRTEYDTLSRPVTVTLNYQPSKPVDQLADMNVRTITQYDGAGNVIGQRDALGRWTKTKYDVVNRPVTVTLNLQDGNPLSGARDADLMAVTQYDALGRVVKTIDNYVNGQFSVTEPITDRITLYQYDTLGRVISSTLSAASPPPANHPELNRLNQTRYDVRTGRVLAQRDSLGRWVAQRYDALGRVVQTVQNCLNPPTSGTTFACGTASSDTNVSTSVVYDAIGRVQGTITALGKTTRTTYDQLGRSVKTTANYIDGVFVTSAPDTDVATSQTYDALGRVRSTTDATSQVTTTEYDRLGRTTVMTDTVGRVTRSGYDGLDQLRWLTTPDNRLTFYGVDGLGRTTTTIVNYQTGASTAPDQDLRTVMTYDRGGRRLSTTDAKGQVTAFAYDTLDRLTAVTENAIIGGCAALPADRRPCNVITSYQYDRAGNRTAIIRPLDGITSSIQRFTYDAANNQVTAIDPLGRVTTVAYDAGSRPTTQLDPRGSTYTLTYGYDGLGRRTTLTAASSSVLSPISMTYDALGRRTAMTDGSGTSTFTPDALGRITQVQAPVTGSVGYTYNARSERIKLTYPAGGPVIDSTYKPDGQLDQVLQSGTALATYQYDTAGRLQQLQRANGATTTYGYDGADRVTDILTSVGGTTVSDFAYMIDKLGLRTQVAELRPEQIGLVADIQSGSASSSPSSGVTIGSTYFFSADDGSHGAELWKSNGTPAGTVLVKDIWPGTDGGVSLGSAAVLNTTLFFAATDGTTGIELWKSDGTAAGTVLVKDIQSGSAASLPANLTVVNGTLYFTATDGTTGVELWKSDGTAAGTTLVKDILSGSGASVPQYLTAANGSLFFIATDGTTGIELWKSDGTSSGTALVKDIRTGSSASLPANLTAVNGTLFFAANDGTNGIELWKSDGTAAGTVLIKDIRAGSASSSPSNLATMNGSLFFSANDGANGAELWKSNGTAAGTVLVKDMWIGSSGSSPAILTAVNGVLFFVAFDGATGQELWKSDGTDPGTVLVKDIVAGVGSANPAALTAANQRLYFKATDATHGTELWQSDGTPAGTALVADIRSGSTSANLTNLQASAGRLFVSADDGVHGQELWSKPSATRTVTSVYDGLQRLTGATDSTGTTYAYTYDLGGNRTSATINGVTSTRTYNAANQVVGWTYDNVGNLLNDGTTTYSYDALNRQITTGGTTNSYNADGVLVQQGTTRYTQDLIAPLSQILSDGTQTYIYGHERLYAQTGTVKTWYASDALGSVRYTTNNVGTPATPITYDPWGGVTSGSVPTFGFTGELQQQANVYLRARWYNATEGWFGSRDAFAGFDEQPYSMHPYAYGYANPVLWTDPTGYEGCNVETGVTTGPSMGGEGSRGGPGGTYPPPTRPTPPEYPDRVWTEPLPPLPPRYPLDVPVLPVLPVAPVAPAVPGRSTIGIVIRIGTIILGICTLSWVNPQPVAPPQRKSSDPCDCFNKQGIQPILSEGASPGPGLGGWGRVHIEMTMDPIVRWGRKDGFYREPV